MLTPVVLDGVRESLAESSTAGWVGCNHDIALVGPCLGVPSCAPAIGPIALGSTVNEEDQGVLL